MTDIIISIHSYVANSPESEADTILLDAADEIDRLRHALATIRDDLSSVSITGEELHNIVGGINDVLNPTATADKEQR